MDSKNMPPQHLWEFGLLSDSAVCSSRAETETFAETASIDSAAFRRYCIYDETYREWRILVEGIIVPEKSL